MSLTVILVIVKILLFLKSAQVHITLNVAGNEPCLDLGLLEIIKNKLILGQGLEIEKNTPFYQ